MAKKDVNRSIKITLDHSDMASKYKELSAKSDELGTALAKLNAEGKGNTREAQAMQKQYDATNKEMEKHRAKVEETRTVLNNLSGATYKELLDVKRQLQKELKEETRGTEAFAEKSEQLARVQEELTNVQGEMNSVSSTLVSTLSSAPGIVGTLTTSFKGLIVACKAFIANPVGAVIAAIGGAVAICVKGFKDFASASEEGGMKAAKSLAPIKVIGTEVGKLFKWIGGYVVDMVAGLTKMVYKAVGWLAPFNDKAKEIYDNMTRQYEIEEKSYQLGKQRQEMTEKEARYNRDLSDLKLKMRQTDKYSAEERKAFMEEYLAKENDLMKLKLDNAQKERELWELESAQDDNDYDANMKGAELNASIYEEEMEYSDKLASMQKRRLALQKELNGESEATVQLIKDAKEQELAVIESQTQAQRAIYDQQYAEGALSKEIYLKKLEDLELDSLRRKFDLYELDKEKRKAIEDEFYKYKRKLLLDPRNQKISPEIKQAQSIADKKTEIAKKGSIELNRIVSKNLQDEQKSFAKQQAMAEQYKGLASGAAESFGNIIGGFIGDSETAAADFQYNMIILALNSLQQMVMIWSAELFGSLTAKLGPIAGPIAAAAGTALINGVFNAVKNSIKRPSTKLSNDDVDNGKRTGEVKIVDTGYASGGYTGDGGMYEPAGIVHKGEYVIPAWQMQRPDTMDMVSVLESVRMSGAAGYADGGAVAGGNDVMLDKIYSLLTSIAQTPIPAYILLSDLEKQQLRRNKAKSYGMK